MARKTPPPIAHALAEELFDLGAAVDLVGQAASQRLGVNQTDLVCLDLLRRQGPMSIGAVAERLGLTVAAISAMAARLERGKLAHREMDATDRRRVILRADDKGVEWVLDLFDSLFKASAALANTESVEDLERLLALMRRFREVLAEHRPG
jgi:DNA-binding MarR family transcriptional regulator